MDEPLRTHIQRARFARTCPPLHEGDPPLPQCGFSSQVVGIFDELGPKYETVNILQAPDLRDGMKEFSSWPTFPQLYVRGAFVGGCDIVKRDARERGAAALLGDEPAKGPSSGGTSAAARAFRDAAGERVGSVLRLEITPEFQYDLQVGPKEAGDIPVHTEAGSRSSSRRRALGAPTGCASISSLEGGGRIQAREPGRPPRVKSMDALALKAWLERRARGEVKLELFDARRAAAGA